MKWDTSEGMSVRRSLALLGGGVVLLLAVLFLVGGVWAGAVHRVATHEGRGVSCVALARGCPRVTPAFVSKVTGLTLPAGTIVTQANISGWSEWILDVTLRLPDGTSIEGGSPEVQHELLPSTSPKNENLERIRYMLPHGDPYPALPKS